MRHIATRRHTSLCALTAVASLLLAAPISARAESLFVSGQDLQGNGVVLQYSPTGADLGTFASVGQGAALGLAFTGGGDLLVANNFNGTNIGNTIHEFSPTGADLGVFASIGMNDPQGLAINQSGDVFVANHGDGTIHEFSPTGDDLGTFANVRFNGLGPIGLGFNSSGDLYVSDSDPSFTSNLILELSPTGTVLAGSLLGGSSKGLAVNAGGNVFVSDVFPGGGLNGLVYEFSPTLALGTPFGPLLNSPYGLAFNSSGDLFAADGDNTINEFSPTGADLGTFASTGTVSPFFVAFSPASAVPLPSSVWTGLALLSGLGLVQLSRRKSVLTA